MCGILGWLDPNAANNLKRFSSALNILSHRGPDGVGIWNDSSILLGHRRLSIIDLSPTGHQPMIDPKSGSVIIFNGMIYNYIELAEELRHLGHKLIGNSDTEVLLHALIEWGHEALPRLNGMWAFAFWSPEKKKLLIARDRFGVKPLYFSITNNGFAFASEPKALLSLFPEYRKINESTLLDFLGNNLLYARGDSFYQGINVFPSAHYATYEVSKKILKPVRYWDYPSDIKNKMTENEALEEFSALFEDSVRLRLKSDVSFSLSLSGGLDSTSILAAASIQSKHPVTCFTSIFEKNFDSELKWAKIACASANSKLITVPALEENWLNCLKEITWHMDGPSYSPAIYPLWNLMENASKNNFKVLLDGQGADESLAGYPQYSVMHLLKYFNRKNEKYLNLIEITKNFLSLINIFGFKTTLGWLTREISSIALNSHRLRSGFKSTILPHVSIPDLPLKINEKDGNSIRGRLIYDHSVNVLPGLLQYTDAISMAHGVEVRNPFLDYRLVEWIFKLPENLVFMNYETKSILRKYLRQNNQAVIGNRLNKIGYNVPINHWINSMESILTDKNSPLLQWCDMSKIKNLIEQTRKGNMSAQSNLYKLLSTQFFIEKCIKN